MKSKILILGAGHLTTPLIKEFSKNYRVIATRATESKLAELELLGAKGVHYVMGASPEVLPKSVDTLIISSPPREGLEIIFEQVQPARIIFISSTSVYGEQGICNEETSPKPISDNGKLLAGYEQKLRKRFPSGLSIIRPGGLIDHNRHPGKFLSAKVIKDPWERVHLIHENDVRWTIKKLIQTEARNFPPLLNLVHPERAYKFDFYNEFCISKNLPPPEVNPSAGPRPSEPHFSRDISSVEILGFLKDLPLYPIDGHQSSY